MATQGLLDSNLDDDAGSSDGNSLLPVVTARDWKSGDNPKFLFWLHTGAEGAPAMPLLHRAVVQFPTPITFTRDGQDQSFLAVWRRYVLPDTVQTSLGQKRYRPKKARNTYPYWYTDRHTKAHRYPAISPTWRLFHVIADAVFAGKLDPNTAMFYWAWTDKHGVAQEMTWTAADCLGRAWLGQDADYTKGLTPRYESVITIADHKDPGAGPKILIASSVLAGAQPEKGNEPGFVARLGSIYTEVLAAQRDIQEKNDILRAARRPEIPVSHADPYHNPYPFRLEYIAEAKPADKYRLTARLADAGPDGIYGITDEIRAAIEAPVTLADLDHVLKPGRHDFDDLHNAIREAAESANCDFVLDRLDEIFAPWAATLERDTAATTTAPEPLFCECGCGLEPSWSECPNCGAAAGGTVVPPVLAELAYDGGTQKCGACGRVARLDAGTCPECGADLPVQIVADLDYDDYSEID